MRKVIVCTLVALLIGAAGGVLFRALGLPLPWTLGAITTTALAAILGNRWPMPSAARIIARPIVGVLAGSAFTPEIVSSIAGWWPGLLMVAMYSLAISVAGYLLFTRVFGFDSATGYFAATPGGLGELSLIGGTMGANTRTLVLIHAVRVIGVVFTIPFLLQFVIDGNGSGAVMPAAEGSPELVDWIILASTGVIGYLMARYLRLPGGPMVAAMLVSAGAHATGLTAAAPPPWLMAFTQVLIGSVAGARFAGITWDEARRGALIAIGWAALMIASAAVAAWIGSVILDIPFGSFLLAMAPGGAAEMIVITYALQADVAFVALCQVLRVFLVLSFVPLFFRFVRVQPRPPDPDRT